MKKRASRAAVTALAIALLYANLSVSQEPAKRVWKSYFGQIPEYPPALKSRGVSGWIAVELSLGKRGDVVAIKNVNQDRGNNELAAAVRAVVNDWLFPPVTNEQCQLVESTTSFDVQFHAPTGRVAVLSPLRSAMGDSKAVELERKHWMHVLDKRSVTAEQKRTTANWAAVSGKISADDAEITSIELNREASSQADRRLYTHVFKAAVESRQQDDKALAGGKIHVCETMTIVL